MRTSEISDIQADGLIKKIIELIQGYEGQMKNATERMKQINEQEKENITWCRENTETRKNLKRDMTISFFELNIMLTQLESTVYKARENLLEAAQWAHDFLYNSYPPDKKPLEELAKKACEFLDKKRAYDELSKKMEELEEEDYYLPGQKAEFEELSLQIILVRQFIDDLNKLLELQREALSRALENPEVA